MIILKIENVMVDSSLIGKEVVYVPDFLLEDFEFGKKLPLNDIDYGKISFISNSQNTIYVSYEKGSSLVPTNPHNIKWRDNVKIKIY